jgi:integrase
MREKIELTNALAKQLAQGSDTYRWDDSTLKGGVDGFGLRAQRGTASWVYVYTLNGVTRRASLGTYPAVQAHQARKKAQEYESLVVEGVDPLDAKKQKIRDARQAKDDAALTFRVLKDEFLAHLEKRASGTDKSLKRLKSRSFTEMRGHLNKHCQRLFDKPVRSIKPDDIKELLASIRKTYPITGDHVQTTLSGMFRWAMTDKDGAKVDFNPVANFKKPTRPPRERVLYDEHNEKDPFKELRLVWNALPPGDFGEIIRLLILTGARREEIGALRWDELDFENRVIRLPGVRLKNWTDHGLPMSDQVHGILERKDKDKGPFVFGQSGHRPFSGWSACKERLDAEIRKTYPIADWRIHDLRRTADTGMHVIGIAPHIVSAVLNHLTGFKTGMSRTYNKTTFPALKREAVQRWADHVDFIITGKTASVHKLRA